jgi:hypothetical protein
MSITKGLCRTLELITNSQHGKVYDLHILTYNLQTCEGLLADAGFIFCLHNSLRGVLCNHSLVYPLIN